MSMSSRSLLSPSNFDIQKAKSFVVMTDWEPDDALFVVGLLRELAKMSHGEKLPPIAECVRGNETNFSLKYYVPILSK